jgi:hypothetical protein
MLYRVLQLFTQETVPMVEVEHTEQTEENKYCLEHDEKYIFPVGTVMHSLDSDDTSIEIRLLNNNSSFYWDMVLANVTRKQQLEEALHFSTLFPACCYKSESIDGFGDPQDLFDYKFYSVITEFSHMTQKMYIEKFGRN